MSTIKTHLYTNKNINLNTTLIITTGIAEYSKSYQELAEHFADKGFNVITYDLRGHGQSLGKRGYINSYNDTLNDLDKLVKKAYDITSKVFLYGHSMGGIITNLYVLERKVDGVIITASPTKLLPLLKPLAIVPKFLINGLKIKTDFNDPNLTHNFQYQKDEHDLDYFYFKTITEIVIKGVKKLNKNFKNYKTPILMIYSESDKSVSVKMAYHMYDKIDSDDKTLLVYKNSYHNLHLDIEKETLKKDIYNWLKDRV